MLFYLKSVDPLLNVVIGSAHTGCLVIALACTLNYDKHIKKYMAVRRHKRNVLDTSTLKSFIHILPKVYLSPFQHTMLLLDQIAKFNFPNEKNETLRYYKNDQNINQFLLCEQEILKSKKLH